MPNITQVIKDIERCINHEQCNGCTYLRKPGGCDCVDMLLGEALELLKDYEALLNQTNT